jgi:hypothetical protein
MSEVERFADIPDPYADVGTAPPLRVEPKRWASSPIQSQVRALRFAAVVAAVLYDAAWPGLIERRPDLRFLSPFEVALGLAIPLGAGALALSAVAPWGYRGLGQAKARVLTLVIASPLVFALATLLTAPAQVDSHRFWRSAMGCALVTALLASGPLALGILAFRRAFVAASFWRTAALGVGSGALAVATMSVVCPIRSASHLLIGHGTLMLLAGIVGALLGRRLCRA